MTLPSYLARELVVDLAVHYEELVHRPIPAWPRRATTSERWDHWCAHFDRLVHLAVDAGCAVELAAERPVDAIAAFAVTVGGNYDLLDLLAGALDDGLSYIGYTGGYFYGGQAWDELCPFRSAVEFLCELSGRTNDDNSEVEQIMAHYGWEMFQTLEIPKGMPERHWWWFRDSP